MKKWALYTAFLLFTVPGCERAFMEQDPGNTPVNCFEIMWKTLDERYALFPFKEVDWDSVYREYRPRIHDRMIQKQLFNTLGSMILELKDGHTDLQGTYGIYSYYYQEGSLANYSFELLYKSYLFTGDRTDDGLFYAVLDSVGLISVPSFQQEISDRSVQAILDSMEHTRGIILDVRNNSGGSDRSAKVMANHFFDKRRKVEVRYYKTGPAHDDLGAVDYWFEPENSRKYAKPVVVLTNRKCYSACNSFVCWMSMLPNVLVAGDTTGGGSGTPYYSELPNGWVFRFSSNVSFRPDGLNIDEGIPPDSPVFLKSSDLFRFRDTMVEFAMDYIHSQSR